MSQGYSSLAFALAAVGRGTSASLRRTELLEELGVRAEDVGLEQKAPAVPGVVDAARKVVTAAVLVPSTLLPAAPVPPQDAGALFGGHFEPGYVTALAPNGKTIPQAAAAAGVHWARYHLNWGEIEPVAGGGYLWPTAAEGELKALADAGLEPIVILGTAPDWAERYPDPDAAMSCGPLAQEAFDDFARFAAAAVGKYGSVARHFLVWNEEDASYPNGYAGFGCWGDRSDADTFGGKYFGELLVGAYSAMKAADPTVQVSMGGFMLSCDSSTAAGGGVCDGPPVRFLRGILEHGASQQTRPFDFVSFHLYTFWLGGGVQLDADLDFDVAHGSPYKSQGGVFKAKVDFVRAELARFGWERTPLMVDEGGHLCWGGPGCGVDPSVDPRFAESQANQLLRLYARAAAQGLTGFSWYGFTDEGWVDSSLIRGGKETPAYRTFAFLAPLLKGMAYGGQLHQGLPSTREPEGYVFYRDQGNQRTEVRLLWSNDGTAFPFPALAGVEHVYDRGGTELAALPATVGFEPVVLTRTYEVRRTYLPLVAASRGSGGP